jgi:branched-chain amino acid transport system ATP-binding protein
LLSATDISKSFGFPALQNVDLAVHPGERLGLIGPNGSGKTTLINIISGAFPADGGRVVFNGRDISRLSAHARARMGIGRTFQIPRPFPSLRVLENVAIASHSVSALDCEENARKALALVGIDGMADKMPASLTQIEMRKLELARALALKPRLLILDEVMAGLTNSEVDETLQLLVQINGQGVAVIMIEHIMRAVMGFCERIVVLNAGRKIAEGKPGEIFADKEVERAYLGE